jgi:hypothetical protein
MMRGLLQKGGIRAVLNFENSLREDDKCGAVRLTFTFPVLACIVREKVERKLRLEGHMCTVAVHVLE